MKRTLALSLTTATLLSLLGGCSSSDSTSTTPTVVVGTAPSIPLNPNPPAIVDSSSTVIPEVVPSEPEEVVLEDLDESEEVTEENEESEEEIHEDEEEVDVGSSATISYASSTQKIIQVEPYLLVADESANQAFHLINDMDTSAFQVGQICETMYVLIYYGPEHTGDENSLITETAAMFLAPVSQEADMVGAYLAVMADTNLSHYDVISMDLSQISNLTVAEKEALWWLVTKSVPEGTEVLLKSKEQLEEVDFSNGLLLSFQNEDGVDAAFQLTYETWESDDSTSTTTVQATPDDMGVYTLTAVE